MESPSLFFFLLLLVFAVVVQVNGGELSVDSPRMITRWQHKQENSTRSLCEEVILPLGYPCIEHTVETEDGYVLAIQQIPHGKGALKAERSWPVFLQHGLFMVIYLKLLFEKYWKTWFSRKVIKSELGEKLNWWS